MLFRSRIKFRRFSNELMCNKQICHFHPENINFHTVSFVSLVLVASLSNRCGRWILFLYWLLFIIIRMMLYYKKYKNFLHGQFLSYVEKAMYQMKKRKKIFGIIFKQINKVEEEFLQLNNITATMNQIVFFTICERILIPYQNVTALYSLMFYNVLTYCILYIKQMIGNPHWSPYINVANHSNIKHLAMSATKIVLEVTKAITFIITIVFMLFVGCLEQRMHYYQPTKYYTLFTGLYYLATEKMFADFFPSLLTYFQISYLENLENLWAPVLLNIITQSLSFGFASILIFYGAYGSAFLTFYLNVYLSYKKLMKGSLKKLIEEKALVSQFRFATKSELEEFEDICAVCLNEMRLAKITPCHHIFHTDCLRKCLLNCDKCPLCKREFKFCQ